MNKNKKLQREEMRSAFQKAAPYLNIIYSFFGAVLFLGYIGHILDQKLNGGPWFLIAGVFLGFVLGLYRMFKVIQDLEKQTKK